MLILVETFNVGTMSGSGHEVVDMLTQQKVHICCLQETRLCGGS